MSGDPNKIEDVDLWKTLDGWRAAPISLDFNRRLFTAIDLAANTNKRRRRTASSVATLGIAFAITLAWLQPKTPGVMSAPIASSATAVDAQAVAQTLSDFDMLKQIDSTRTL